MVKDFKLVVDDQRCVPSKKDPLDIGYDLHAFDIIKGYRGTNLMEDDEIEKLRTQFIERGYITLGKNERILFDSGVRVADMNHSIELQVRPRSGVSLKRGLLTIFGTVDPNYRGKIGIIVENSIEYPNRVERFERVAQLVPVDRCLAEMHIVTEEEVTETNRGVYGFGSTGTM